MDPNSNAHKLTKHNVENPALKENVDRGRKREETAPKLVINSQTSRRTSSLQPLSRSKFFLNVPQEKRVRAVDTKKDLKDAQLHPLPAELKPATLQENIAKSDSVHEFDGPQSVAQISHSRKWLQDAQISTREILRKRNADSQAIQINSTLNNKILLIVFFLFSSH